MIEKIKKLILGTKTKNVASILGVFKKTVDELKSHAEAKDNEIVFIDTQIKVAEANKAIAIDEAAKAKSVAEKLLSIVS
jgi:hypothetical protein